MGDEVTPLANKKKYPSVGNGSVVIVAWARHWRTGKRIYPVRAKALAFIPRKGAKSA